jgi:hypothetical protein
MRPSPGSQRLHRGLQDESGERWWRRKRKQRKSEIEGPDLGILYDVTHQHCHSEQREESLRETLRCAQGDITVAQIFCDLIYRSQPGI